ncbi:MAG TPA: hypothetical protein VK474_10550 [Chthoniobacterales bacterium]|nr:hypothetical protein [Chthoniobacterales bacterium]
MPAALHLNLDAAWNQNALGLPVLDASAWGPRLRFSAPPSVVEKFFGEYDAQLAPFILYGSGDFHHLSALWLRRCAEPVVVVSFDNHPDWDVRPPRWCCGGWVNRALELPQVCKVSVWGCGNFECWWPGQLFGNRRAEKAGELEVHAWADDRSAKKQKRRGAIFRATWREEFERFVAGIDGAAVYVTVDMDCLQASEAMTNWENGKFSVDDVKWALGRLRAATRIVGGDICGAFSPPKYARLAQRFVATIDHPTLPPRDLESARQINEAALEELWPILTQ